MPGFRIVYQNFLKILKKKDASGNGSDTEEVLFRQKKKESCGIAVKIRHFQLDCTFS